MRKQKKNKCLKKEVNRQVRTFWFMLREFHAVRGEATCLQPHFSIFKGRKIKDSRAIR